jgi:hypothetical protein
MVAEKSDWGLRVNLGDSVEKSLWSGGSPLCNGECLVPTQGLGVELVDA